MSVALTTLLQKFAGSIAVLVGVWLTVMVIGSFPVSLSPARETLHPVCAAGLRPDGIPRQLTQRSPLSDVAASAGRHGERRPGFSDRANRQRQSRFGLAGDPCCPRRRPGTRCRVRVRLPPGHRDGLAARCPWCLISHGPTILTSLGASHWRTFREARQTAEAERLEALLEGVFRVWRDVTGRLIAFCALVVAARSSVALPPCDS